MTQVNKPEDIFMWAVERCPQIITNIDINNKKSFIQKAPTFNNLYINISHIIKTLLKCSKFIKIKDLLVPLKQKINEILDLIQPNNSVFFAIDGTKPAALLKKEKEEFFKLGDYSGSYVSLNHLLPNSDNIR